MPSLFDSGPEMSAEELRLISQLIQRTCGLEFGEDQRFLLERRLRERIRALALSNYGDYYRYLTYHPDAHKELERAAEVLTTNETYFFREDYQLKAFRREILSDLRQRGLEQDQKRLVIWSAGCSTGEEVYSIAMIIHESGLFRGWNVRVIGSDISRRVLSVARRGCYRDASFRAMPPEFEHYFDEVSGGGRRVSDRIRSMCHFSHLNLLDRRRTAIVGRVDVVFCRNVMIYFDQASRKTLIQTLYNRLVPQGYLLLGHSESLLNVSTAFELVHLHGDLVYQKPAAGRSIPVPGETL